MSLEFDSYLQDIVDAIDRIQEYMRGIAREVFETDGMRFDAVIRNLEVIGEAVKQVPDSIREEYPNVEWRKIAGLRDVLIHRYFHVNIDIVWDVVQSNIPKLKMEIEQIIWEKCK